jgi:hypothetical protein
MAYAVLALCLVAGIGLMGRWLLNAEPRDILRVIKWVAITLGVGVALLIVTRGRLEWLMYILPFALPFLIRWAAVWRAVGNAAKMARGPTPGRTSGVRTRWLAMTLDHDSGAMDGEVLLGPFAGRWLSELSPDELRSLADELDEDAESRQVFDAWLERMGADAAPGAAPPPQGEDESVMTPAKAREILGVAEEASEQEIREAHRRLMLANHPDRGGSSWLAAQINRAKDVLLARP